MATIINTPGQDNSGSSAAGWAVAVVILIVVVAGLFWYFRYHNAAAPANPGATIQVNLPAGGGPNSGGTAPAPAQ